MFEGWSAAIGAIGAAATVGSAVVSSNAAGNAANAQAQGSANQIAEQQREYDQTRTDQAPWRTDGGLALNRLNAASTGNFSSFKTSPDYAWTVSQGQKGIQQTAAARGGLYSGNALKALTDYNQNQASGQYNNWWNQQAGLAGVGQSATNTTDALGQQSANAIGSAYANQGDARASGILGSANGINNSLNTGFQNYLGYENSQNNYLNTPIDTSWANAYRR